MTLEDSYVPEDNPLSLAAELKEILDETIEEACQLADISPIFNVVVNTQNDIRHHPHVDIECFASLLALMKIPNSQSGANKRRADNHNDDEASRQKIFKPNNWTTDSCNISLPVTPEPQNVESGAGSALLEAEESSQDVKLYNPYGIDLFQYLSEIDKEICTKILDDLDDPFEAPADVGDNFHFDCGRAVIGSLSQLEENLLDTALDDLFEAVMENDDHFDYGLLVAPIQQEDENFLDTVLEAPVDLGDHFYFGYAISPNQQENENFFSAFLDNLFEALMDIDDDLDHFDYLSSPKQPEEQSVHDPVVNYQLPVLEDSVWEYLMDNVNTNELCDNNNMESILKFLMDD